VAGRSGAERIRYLVSTAFRRQFCNGSDEPVGLNPYYDVGFAAPADVMGKMIDAPENWSPPVATEQTGGEGRILRLCSCKSSAGGPGGFVDPGAKAYAFLG